MASYVRGESQHLTASGDCGRHIIALGELNATREIFLLDHRRIAQAVRTMGIIKLNKPTSR
jgi:hypothetical protein